MLVHNASGVLVRVCEHCGASWKLGPTEVGNLNLAWRPIAELDVEGLLHPGVQIDVLYCPVEPEVKPVQQQQQQQVFNPNRGNAGMCACGECKGKKQHWSGSDTCACKRCEGKRSHQWS